MPVFIINSVALPVTAITTIVDMIVITTTGNIISFKSPQAVTSPTPPGINISGIISIRKSEVLSTCSSFTTFVHKSISIIISPYMLAGTGIGIK